MRSAAAMLSLQARDTGYEAEDLLDVHVAGDGGVDLSDGILIFNHLFLGAEGPPEPRDCGEDPTEDELGCASYDCG